VFPAASFAVIVTFCVPPAVCDAEPVMTSDAAAPGPVGVTSAVADVRTPELKVTVVAEEVEPVKARPVKVATPLTAETVVVPASDPAPAAIKTLAVDEVTVFPVASVMRTTGCVDRVAPDEPATGAVTTKIFAAAPTTNETEAVFDMASVFSVALTTALPTVVGEVSVAV
jgi:hypothetical protein